MKNFKISCILFSFLFVNFAQAQRIKPYDQTFHLLTEQPHQMRFGRVQRLRANNLKIPAMKLIDERFRSLGFTPRNGNNDAMLLKNVALFNEVNGVKKVTHRIDVEFYGYANADNSKVGLMAYMNVNGKIYRGMIYGNKSDSLENYEEYVVFDSKFQRSLENVSNGLHLFPAPPSHSKIKRFFRCLGSELKHGCTSECSANTLKECAIAGGTVGTVIGAAVGSAIPAAGTAVGAAVGAVWGFITCLGWTCGKCAFGGFLECFALFF